jgi:hypothetical protein
MLSDQHDLKWRVRHVNIVRVSRQKKRLIVRNTTSLLTRYTVFHYRKTALLKHQNLYFSHVLINLI